jgi:hypothetical protein
LIGFTDAARAWIAPLAFLHAIVVLIVWMYGMFVPGSVPVTPRIVLFLTVYVHLPAIVDAGLRPFAHSMYGTKPRTRPPADDGVLSTIRLRIGPTMQFSAATMDLQESGFIVRYWPLAWAYVPWEKVTAISTNTIEHCAADVRSPLKVAPEDAVVLRSAYEQFTSSRDCDDSAVARHPTLVETVA